MNWRGGRARTWVEALPEKAFWAGEEPTPLGAEESLRLARSSYRWGTKGKNFGRAEKGFFCHRPAMRPGKV